MSNEQQASPDVMRVDNSAAQRLLARAAELDALTESSSIAELRQAAREAGISTGAFEAALRELRDDRGITALRDEPAPTPAMVSRSARVTTNGRRWIVRALAAATVLIAVGAAAVGLRREHFVSAPPSHHAVRAVHAVGARAVPSSRR